MSKPNTYRDLIFTNHAYHRLKQRSLSQDGVWQTIHHPVSKFKSGKGSKYIREISGRNYQVIANYLPKENKYLVVSVWVRGEDDKLPLGWQIIRLPFAIGWFVVKKIFKRRR